MHAHPNHLFSFEWLSCSVASGNNAAHFAWFPQERALLWKTTIEEGLQVPRESQGFALLVVVSAVSWKMVWNWEDPSELWEGKLHPSQLLTNGKRKHQSDKPGAEVSGCGFKGIRTSWSPPCRALSWSDWVPLQSSSERIQSLLGLLTQTLRGKLLAGRMVGTKSHSFPCPLADHLLRTGSWRGTGHSMVSNPNCRVPVLTAK